MRIGIYTRKQSPVLPTMEWLIENEFDSFKIYEENLEDEYEDVSQRETINMLIYDGEKEVIDAVYIHDLSMLSPITVKLLQCLIEFQKVNLPIYYPNGCIYPSDKTLAHLQNKIYKNWEQIRRESKIFESIQKEISDFNEL